MHSLTYDTLPAHSTLRREVVGEVLKITSAAEEPGAAALLDAKKRSAIGAALLSGALLAAFLAAFGSTYLTNRRNISGSLAVILFVAFAVFCGALFLLVWRTQYAAHVEALEHALKQTTILAGSPARLLVETSGPLGQASVEMLGGEITFRRARCAARSILSCLEIIHQDGESIRVLSGRSAAELEWVVRAMKTALAG